MTYLFVLPFVDKKICFVSFVYLRAPIFPIGWLFLEMSKAVPDVVI